MFRALLAAIVMLACLHAPCAWAAEDPGNHWLDTSRNCGPLCLLFLDGYYGGGRDYESIVRLCPPKSHGTNLEELSQGASGSGYYTAAFRGTANQLTRLRYPAIVRYRLTDEEEASKRRTGDHFVVILGWNASQRAFRVFDPPASLASVPFVEVAGLFSGYGVVVGDRPLPPLEELLEPHWGWPWLGFVAGLSLTTFAIVWLGLRAPRSMAVGLAMATVCASGCGTDPPVVAALAKEGSQFDAGIISEGKAVKHRFRAYNTSDKPLRFERVESTCSCAKSIIGGQQTVKPGGFAEIEVEVDTRGLRGSQVRNFIVVTDGDGKSQFIKLELRAHVERPAEARPAAISVATVTSSEPFHRDVHVQLNRAELGRRFRGISSDNALVQVSLLEQLADRIDLRVALLAKRPPGTLRAAVRLAFDDPNFSELVIPVTGIVDGELRCTPARLLIQPANVFVVQRQKVRIESRNNRAFRILSVECPSGVELDSPLGDAAAVRHEAVFRVNDASTVKASEWITVRTDRADDAEVLLALDNL